jgi:NitT/TauT family transport system permease protein
MPPSTEGALQPDAAVEAATGASRARPAPGGGRARGWSGLPVWLRRSLLLAGLVLLWDLYIRLADVDRLLFVGPVEVGRAFVDGWLDGRLVDATIVTLRILLLGMLIGTLVATVLVTLATWTKVGEDLLTLLTSMLNPLPAIAILPFAILWFGLSSRALVFVIANAVTWPIALNLASGFRTVPPTIVMVGQTLGLRGYRMVRDVLLPAALPEIITGLKTGWAFGWRTIIAAELVFGVAGGKGGLGFFINESRVFLRLADGVAGLVTIALIGIALDTVFSMIERRTVVRWGMKSAA